MYTYHQFLISTYSVKLQMIGFLLLLKVRKYNDQESQGFPLAGIFLENSLEKNTIEYKPKNIMDNKTLQGKLAAPA